MMIPEVIERHFFEFQALWEQRHEMLFSSELSRVDLLACESRMSAHLDGILLAGDAVLPMLRNNLFSGEASMASAAAYVLLRLNRADAAMAVIESLAELDGELLDGIRLALCHAPLDLIETHLQDLTLSGSAPVAAMATETLVWHGKAPAGDRMAEFFQDQDPLVRKAAWRAASLFDVVQRD